MRWAPLALDQLAGVVALVGGEVVDHHQIAFREGRGKQLLDVGLEGVVADRVMSIISGDSGVRALFCGRTASSART